jgi:signal transduction histidine kinase
LWFASGTALVRLRGGKFHAFYPFPGPSRDWLFQILTDDHGYIWFGSSRTVSRVARAALDDVADGRTRDLPVMSFDMTDTRREIAARRARNAGAWKSRDGRLWFATLRGVVTVDPTKVRTNRRVPPVLIERAMVDGVSALPEHKRAFPPGLGNLEFTYSGVTLLEPRKAMHRYQLEGFDPHWIDAGTRRVAYYTNIGPGKYRFRVQASNADGLWNEAGAAVAIELAPHFYQTLWFAALGVLLVGGIGFWFYRARLGRLRGQYLAVFAERSRVARELHDSLLQGMSAVALELANIRTALPTSAAGPASRLEAVEDALTESLEETRRFVWNLREQPTGTGDLGLALTRLAGRLTEGRAITCEVKVEGTAVHLSHDAQGALFKIAQEAITNALRHAEARRIDVALRYRDGKVELVVADDGRGFDPAHAEGPEERHFGLVGMSERARRLHGHLNIDSQPGAGARITFLLPTGSRRTTHA